MLGGKDALKFLDGRPMMKLKERIKPLTPWVFGTGHENPATPLAQINPFEAPALRDRQAERSKASV
jgi:hypothetical protein